MTTANKKDRGPNALVKGWTFSGTIFKHTGFPYSIRSSYETATLQGSLFGSTSPPLLQRS
jgi:hypothetical protein